LISVGLDVGSRTIKLVTFDTVVRSSLVTETGANPLRRCRELISGINYERLVVTGYGRHLVAPALGGEIVSEIRAFAVGAGYLFPDCRTIIDIGGQDCKVILLTNEGEVQKFEMNDRCAAGTGKFLEIMANTLEVNISGLGNLALSASKLSGSTVYAPYLPNRKWFRSSPAARNPVPLRLVYIIPSPLVLRRWYAASALRKESFLPAGPL